MPALKQSVHIGLRMTVLLVLCAVFFCAVCAADVPTVYVAADGDDSAAGTADAPLATLYGAFRALPDGGKAVVCGRIESGTAVLPAADGIVTICGTDANAVLALRGSITFQSAVEMENLHIAAAAKNLIFLCGGNFARFGEGLTVTAEGDANLPGITAGASGTVPADSSYLEICSGSWYRIRGGARGAASAASGDTCLVIYDGDFNSTFDLGGDSATAGDAYLYIFGGEFRASVNLASAADTRGNIYATLADGDFAAPIRLSRGGNIGGNVTLHLLCDTAKPTTAGTGHVAGQTTVQRLAGVRADADGFNVQSIDAKAADAIREADAAHIAAMRAAKLPTSAGAFAARDMTPCGSAVGAQPAVPVGLGDMDSDGKLTLSDVLQVLLLTVRGTYTAAADADLSGAVTAQDAWAICSAAAAGKTSVTPEIAVNKLSDKLSLYGGATVKDGGITRGYAFGTTDKTAYTLYADCRFDADGKAALYFGCNLENGLALADGYCFEVGADGTAAVYRVMHGRYRRIAVRSVPLHAGQVRLRAVYADGAATLYLEDNPFDAAPYPLFNLMLPAAGGACGVYAEAAAVSLPMLGGAAAADSKTYTNTIFEQFTDPEVFFENGRFYFYGTQSSTADFGVKCYSTADFRIFKDEGFVLSRGNAFGDGVFKAANIVKYGDDYYLFYMAESDDLGVGISAYATAKSPTGPFKNETGQPLTDSRDRIGGQPFVDAVGQPYLIYTRTTGGNKLYGAKLTLDGGKATFDLSTETLLLAPTEPWENARAAVVECGYIVRHGDLYYLLYSGGNYNSAYGMGYATAKSPLGPYTKYEKNPILVSNDQAFGVGAATVFPAPDGSEHFIAYLRNFSPTVTRPLCTCMDRIKFVPDPDGGADRLTVYGPTVTPQPLPSGLGSTAVADWQRLRFVW